MVPKSSVSQTVDHGKVLDGLWAGCGGEILAEVLESEPALHSPHSGGSCPTGLGLAPYSRHCDLVHGIAAPLKFGPAVQCHSLKFGLTVPLP